MPEQGPPDNGGDWLEDDDPETAEAGTFTPDQLDRTVLALPLIWELKAEGRRLRDGQQDAPKAHPVVIELNLEHSEPTVDTRKAAFKLIDHVMRSPETAAPAQSMSTEKSERSSQYLYAHLRGDAIRQLVRLNEPDRPIFRIWPDFPIGRL